MTNTAQLPRLIKIILCFSAIKPAPKEEPYTLAIKLATKGKKFKLPSLDEIIQACSNPCYDCQESIVRFLFSKIDTKAYPESLKALEHALTTTPFLMLLTLKLLWFLVGLQYPPTETWQEVPAGTGVNLKPVTHTETTRIGRMDGLFSFIILNLAHRYNIQRLNAALLQHSDHSFPPMGHLHLDGTLLKFILVATQMYCGLLEGRSMPALTAMCFYRFIEIKDAIETGKLSLEAQEEIKIQEQEEDPQPTDEIAAQEEASQPEDVTDTGV